MLYAYARICGIVPKLVWPKPASIILIEHDSERQLNSNLLPPSPFYIT